MILRTLQLLLFGPLIALRAWLDQRSRVRMRGRIVHLKLSGGLPDLPPRRSPFVSDSSPSLPELLVMLEGLRTDPRVQELWLSIRGLACGWARAAELRAALVALRESGRTVRCFLESPGQLDYLVASAADEIQVPPLHQQALTGLRMESWFFRGSLDWLGVRPEVIHAGRFKDMGEMFERTERSGPSREAAEALLDDLQGALAESLREGRGLEPERAAELASSGPYSADEMLASGLADKVGYRRETPTQTWEQDPEVEDSRRDLIPASRYIRGQQRLEAGRILLRRPPAVAVLHLAGPIIDGRANRPGNIAARDLVPVLRRVARDREVAAVVLRVDSPGGSATASDLLFHELRHIAARKPLVCSMGNVAASGGYYLAAACQRIYASPTTITGSIGVVTLRFAIEQLRQKLLVEREVLSRAKHGGLLSLDQPLSDEERALVQRHVDDTYQTFLARVSMGRGMPVEDIAPHAEGRVWTGSRAHELGLIDELGGLPEAIDAAWRMTGRHGQPEIRAIDSRPRPRLMPLLTGMNALGLEQRLIDRAAHLLGWREQAVGLRPDALLDSGFTRYQPLALMPAWWDIQ